MKKFIALAGILASAFMFISAMDLYSAAAKLTDLVGGSVSVSVYLPSVAFGVFFLAVALGISRILKNTEPSGKTNEANPASAGTKSGNANNQSGGLGKTSDTSARNENIFGSAKTQKVNVKDIEPSTKQVIDLIFKEGKVSESSIQEKLSISYADIPGILNKIKNLGIIEQPEGLSIYKIIMTEEEHKSRLTYWG